MRLYGEIIGKGGLTELIAGEKISWIPGGGGYFQGVKTLGSFSREKVVLICRSGAIEITGENFVIGKYCDGDLLLNGAIATVGFLANAKR